MLLGRVEVSVLFCMVAELNSWVTQLKVSAENFIAVYEEDTSLYSFVYLYLQYSLLVVSCAKTSLACVRSNNVI